MEPRISEGWRNKETTSIDRNLAASVIIQALTDAHSNDEQVRQEAHDFLFSDAVSHAIVRAYWLNCAGVRVNKLDSIRGLSLEQIRRRMEDERNHQRRAKYSERKR